MAKCKYCHEVISRLDKEICPFCGGIKPLDGTDTTTQDVTKVIDQLEHPVKIKHKKRLVAALLAFLFGFLGAPHFYIGKNKKGLFTAIFCLVFIGGVGALLFFVAGLKNFLAFLIPYLVIELYSIFIGYMYLTKHNIQDSHGEFLE